MGRQGEEGEDVFFDSKEDISSVFNSCPGSPGKNYSLPDDRFISKTPTGPWSEVWSTNPDSVRERRDRFMRWLGIDPTNSSLPSSSDPDGQVHVDDEIQPDINGITSDSGSALRGSEMKNSCSMSKWSIKNASPSCNEALEENLVCRIDNLDSGALFGADDLSKDCSLRSLSEVGSSQSATTDEFERTLRPSSFVQRLMLQEDNASSKSCSSPRKMIEWLRKLGAVACIRDGEGDDCSSFSDSDSSGIARSGRVEVKPCKKQLKELSAVYKRQDIKAHDGAILTMKFSSDGQYLASGGTDGIVRVWRAVECERTNEISIPDNDPSCIYFTVNHSAELTPVHADKLTKTKSRSMRRTADSACVVLPPDVFRLSESPLHEFHGHDADVLDLSWSSNKHLLSSSKDKTVRLWQVGSDSCLKVFSHTNYVTCVQYNPVDENYFISGCIDGKVRVWDMSGSQVVDWVDIREIVTAICYRPNGKGVVVGTLTGNCRFYNAPEDDHLQIEAQVSLQDKKKSSFKHITGFQFCPRDPQKLMVTSADSQIRILDGIDVVSKYKGFHNARSQISASFTADGQRIISASEDCNVHVWSHDAHEAPTSDHVKSICSFERFFSSNASIAIPWHGMQSTNRISVTSEVLRSQRINSDQAGVTENECTCHSEDSNGNNNTLYLSPSGSFTLSNEFFSDLLPKGSATWPEEKLSSNSAASNLSKSHYKFLKTSCQNTSHAWGQVILTAGWDGWIRSYQNFGLPVHL